MPKLTIDPWQPEYGAQAEIGLSLDELPEPSVQVDPNVETDDWSEARSPQPGGQRPPFLFIDGVRRIDCRLLVEEGAERAWGLLGSFGVGAVLADGGDASWQSARIERLAIVGAGLAIDPVEVTVGEGSVECNASRAHCCRTKEVRAPGDCLRGANRRVDSLLRLKLAGGRAWPSPTTARADSSIASEVQRTMRSKLSLVATVGFAAALVAPTAVLAAGPTDHVRGTGVRDITATALGQSIAGRAAEHRIRLGAPHQKLKVYQDASGYTVVPDGTPIAAVASTDDNGQPVIAYAPVVMAAADSTGGSDSLTTSPSWSFVTSNCYARISDSWSWMDHCTQIYHLLNDGDGTREYYALQHYATAAGNWPWSLWWGKISSSPIVTGNYGAQTWVDWSPKSDYSGNCRDVTLNVNAVFVGLSYTAQECEQWHLTKANPAVNYTLQGDWHVAYNNARELAYENAVWVAQGKSVAWTVPAEVHGGAL